MKRSGLIKAILPGVEDSELAGWYDQVTAAADKVDVVAVGRTAGSAATLMIVGPDLRRSYLSPESPDEWRAASLTVEPGTGRLEVCELDRLRSSDSKALAKDLDSRLDLARAYEAVSRHNQSNMFNKSERLPYPPSPEETPGALFSFKKTFFTPDDLLDTARLSVEAPGILRDAILPAVNNETRDVERMIRNEASREAQAPGPMVLRSWTKGEVVIHTMGEDAVAEDDPEGIETRYRILMIKGSGNSITLDWEDTILVRDGEQVVPGQPLAQAVGEESKESFAMKHAAMAYEAFRADALAVIVDKVSPCLDRFTKSLDQDALGKSSIDGSDDIALYDFYHADGDQVMRRNRLQAAESLPVLRTILPQNNLVVEAIDSGQSLQAALQEVYGVGKAGLKHLRETKIEDFGSDDPIRAARLVQGLGALRPDHYPGRGTDVDAGAQWTAFDRTWTVIETACREINLASGPVLAIERPLWLKGATASGVDIIEMRDTIKGFERHVLTPIALDVLSEKGRFDPSKPIEGFDLSNTLGRGGWNGSHEILHEAVTKGRSLARIGELADRYHAQGSEIGKALAGAGENDALTWPALTAPYKAPNGLTIQALTSNGALMLESEALNHCVGRGMYLPKCLYENTHILSVRDADGKARSTIEVAYTPAAPDFRSTSAEREAQREVDIRIVQHKAHDNRDPTKKDRDAVDSWARDVQSGKLAIDQKHLAGALAERTASRGEREVINLVGYDPANSDMRTAMFKAYAFMLPRNERELTLDEWVNRKGLKGMMAKNIDKADEDRRLKRAARRGELASAAR